MIVLLALLASSRQDWSRSLLISFAMLMCSN